jgi:thiamine-phosphate pyrophosphorylase
MVHRVVDANINRAAEGMRVLEDVARFVLGNKDLCSAIKKCRHELRHQTPELTSRDTEGDVGTTLSTAQETSRGSIHDIATAAGNRCCEALRVIEEFLKLENTKNTIESIRYKMYDLTEKTIQALGAHIKEQWSLCFVMTVDQCVLPWQDTLAQTLVSGCDCVQVREKNLTTTEYIAHVREVKNIADPFNVPVIVNDRVDVMLATNATGVHLGGEDMSIQDARKMCGSLWTIGATVHCDSLHQVEECIASGADYVGVGSMFASQTKPEVQVAPLGLLKNAISHHHLAIGGITPENVSQLYDIGCKGIAVSYVIAQSTTPEKVVAALLQQEHQTA